MNDRADQHLIFSGWEIVAVKILAQELQAIAPDILEFYDPDAKKYGITEQDWDNFKKKLGL